METPRPSTSTSTSNVVDIITHMSSLSFTQQETNRIDQLVEYSYVPDDVHVLVTSQPLINPYGVYNRRRGFTPNIQQLLGRSRPTFKEYVQSSNLNQCQLMATD